MKKIFVALAVLLMLLLFAIVAFAAPVVKDIGPATKIVDQSASVPASSAVFAKFDIKTIGFAGKGFAETIKLGALNPGGMSAVLGKTIVLQASKSVIANNVETKTAPNMILIGKTFISCSASRTEIDTDHSTYVEPHASYVIARATSGTLALL